MKKLHKIRKNPERALHVVKGDLANFFGFHRFGIKESAVMPQRGREGTPRAGLCFFTELNSTAMFGEMVLLT